MHNPFEPYKLGACTIYPPTTNKGWRVRYVDNGRRREKSTRDQESAEKAAAELSARVAAPSTNKNITVSHAADGYLTTIGDGNYYARQEGHLRRWVVPVIGDLLLTAWQPGHSRQVLQRMVDADKSKETVRNAKGAMRGVISYAQGQGWYTAADDPLLKVWQKIRFPFEEEEAAHEGESADFIARDTLPTRHDIDLIAKAAPTEASSLAWRLASYSGLRWGELCGLRGTDVDLEKRIVYVRRSIERLSDGTRRVKSTKNRKQRFSIFPASLVSELREQIAEAGGGILFPGDRGDWADGQLNRRRWIRAAQKAGWPFRQIENPSANQQQWPCPEWSFHDLRHHAACWMIFDLKAPLPEVATWLGHHSPSFTFDKYVGRRGNLVQIGLDLTEGW